MIGTDEKQRALSTVGLFRGCSKRELTAISRLCTEVHVDRGFVLTTQGGQGHECFVIGDGHASVQIDDHVVGQAGPGDVVGEIALLDGGRRTATVTARTPMTVYVLGQREFRALVDSGTVSRRIMVGLSRRLRNAEAAAATSAN